MLNHGLIRWTPVLALLAFVACEDVPTAPDVAEAGVSWMDAKGGTPGAPSGESAGSNLSFPTIWAEGITKDPRGAMGTVDLGGAWWYWWGEPLVENGDPQACEPDPEDTTRCIDGSTPGTGSVKAYLQKDAANEWQADNAVPAEPVYVDRIDWGDAIESVAWTIKSKVRIETTLFEDVITPMTGYTMRHTSGHGITEMWGVDAGSGAPTALEYESPEAIVFSACARLGIQKLLVDRDILEPLDSRFTWNPDTGLWEGDDISPAAVFNDALAPEGPERGFGAEINIQGKIVYGMTWDVKRMNDGVGDYRITYSLDDANCPTATLNTSLENAVIIALEEEGEDEAEFEVAAEAGPGEGGTAYVDAANNLTYIDIRIALKETGKGGGGGGGGGNGGGGSSGGGSGGGGGGGGSGPGGSR